MLFSPEDHASNGPDTWQIVKSGRAWALCSKDGVRLETGIRTKRDAEERREGGFYVNLYEKERRYYAGQDVPGWKPSPYGAK